ncbi:hypothetical protein LSH36_441g02003 [Paralvinella palmiformis]|uniref:Uncharacterized protein n=1 Tax=Paralvinella palmiformis TaxID=53620 RepID=A0AAD9JAV1_9ANNE|nr:hypothetical protein LSH36_441g02003 [Paralvinella palmiformis]
MLPGLHYLHNDLQQVAPEMVNVVTSMIRDFEDKVESGKLVDRPPNVQSAAVLTPGEKMLNRFKDVAQSKPTFSKIFGKK